MYRDKSNLFSLIKIDEFVNRAVEMKVKTDVG